MLKVANFADANAALARFVPNARIPGSYSLDNMRALMNFLGNPQNDLKVIHVAGTSGKTSTSYYAAALLQAAGNKVGLTVSPHVIQVNERIQINCMPLAETEFCHELSVFLLLIEKCEIKPTYFEVLVAFAYWEFAKQRVDYAVVEVGLGGLLDGTNVIDRADKVCIITDIGLDHVNILGNTLSEIAAQKAGIIQHENVVLCYQQTDEIINVFKIRAKEQQAKLYIVKLDDEKSAPDLLPLFQKRNFSLAKATVDFILKRDSKPKLSEDQLLAAAHTLVPARMEIFHYKDKTIILDGAHNAQKLKALAESVKAKFPDQKVAALVSFVDGRSFRLESSLLELSDLTKTLIITNFHVGQDMPHGAVEPKILGELAKQQGFDIISIVKEPHGALTELLRRPEPIVLVTGSFFLIHELRPEVQKL